jgi:alpha-galactosidase
MSRFVYLCSSIAAAALAGSLDAQSAPAPLSAPAQVTRTGDHLTLRYDGRVLLDARLATRGRLDVRTLVDSANGAVTQVVKLTAFGDGARMTLDGTVTASAEGFAVEPEPRTDALPVVRHASGPSFNRLNRGVYDRQRDWMFSVDAQAKVRVTPGAGADSTRYAIEASGFEIALRFRPRYFARHRGLARFEPWRSPVKTRSVAGWTSWFAFLDTVTEQHVAQTASVLGRDLAPWGYTVMQLDDGYQRLPLGPVANWLGTNAKFPGGVRGIRTLMSGAGLEPGIWTNVAFEDTAYARAHPRLFVRGDDGRPAYGNWVGFSFDGSVRGALDTLVRPVYRGLREAGFTYFKLDALRHLRYEGYNSLASSFATRGMDREQAFRDVVAAVRGEIGVSAYLLACWGIRPELAGLVDAVRVGTDGFGYGGFAQYNSWNNVVWRNDPDHVEIAKPDGVRAATLASLTGSILMLTDPPSAYTGARLDAARRVTPVLFTLPEQGYDVDPSRSRLIAGAQTELSGSGSRPFDADRALVVPLTLLDVSRPWGHWSVLARTGGADTVRFADLGIPDDAPQVVFEFWSKRMLGAVTGRLVAEPVAANGVQVFCIRAVEARPQLLATNRHVSCGGAEVRSLAWAGDTLRGESELVAGDTYEVYVTEVSGWRVDGVEVEGARALESRVEGGVRVVRMVSERGGRVRWAVRYAR